MKCDFRLDVCDGVATLLIACDGRGCWDRDKDVNGGDLVEGLFEMFEQYGMLPPAGGGE